MSTAPLKARLLRFVAVVASAPFLLIMLGDASQTAQSSNAPSNATAPTSQKENTPVTRHPLGVTVKNCDDCLIYDPAIPTPVPEPRRSR